MIAWPKDRKGNLLTSILVIKFYRISKQVNEILGSSVNYQNIYFDKTFENTSVFMLT